MKLATLFAEDIFRLDREMLYVTACVTGFRAPELAALRPRDFNFDRDTAEVVLSGAFTKNEKKAIQPLPADVANALRECMAGKPTASPVWPGTWNDRAADMLRVDLDAAGIPYCIERPEGRLNADFHALRHSFVALLDKAGATLKEAMQLARHSSPKLTMKVYGKARLVDLASAVDRLPSLTAPEADPWVGAMKGDAGECGYGK